MSRILSRLFDYTLSLTPKQLLGRMWLLLLYGQFISFAPPLSGLAAVIFFTAYIGYPYLVVIHCMPRNSVSGKLARWLFGIWLPLALVIAVALGISPDTTAIPEWIGITLAITVNICVFSPFFMAAHAMKVKLKTQNTYKPLDFLPTFIGFYFGIFGGYLYTHKLLREIHTNNRSDADWADR